MCIHSERKWWITVHGLFPGLWCTYSLTLRVLRTSGNLNYRAFWFVPHWCTFHIKFLNSILMVTFFRFVEIISILNHSLIHWHVYYILFQLHFFALYLQYKIEWKQLTKFGIWFWIEIYWTKWNSHRKMPRLSVWKYLVTDRLFYRNIPPVNLRLA